MLSQKLLPSLDKDSLAVNQPGIYCALSYFVIFTPSFCIRTALALVTFTFQKLALFVIWGQQKRVMQSYQELVSVAERCLGALSKLQSMAILATRDLLLCRRPHRDLCIRLTHCEDHRSSEYMN